MKRAMGTCGRNCASDVAEILAAGFLRRIEKQTGGTPGCPPGGLDVFEDVSIHCDRPGAKGEGR
ncbi:MAG: hypothetical protein ABFD46_08355 [Armatimonadota bacterium]